MSRTFTLLLLLISAAAAAFYFRVLAVEPVDLVTPVAYKAKPAIDYDKIFNDKFERYLTGHRLLVAGKYPALHQYIDEQYQLLEAGEITEEELSFAIAAITLRRKEDAPHYQQLVTRYPDSPYSYLLSAQFYLERSYEERGSKWSKDTTEEQFANMHAYHALAIADYKKAISLKADLMAAYSGLINLYSAAGENSLKDKAFIKAININPASWLVWSSYIDSNQPRWRGSHKRMDELAQQAQKLSPDNPELKHLRWFSTWDKADTLLNKKAYDEVLALIEAPLAEGGHAVAYYLQGRVYYGKGQYKKAISAFTRSLIERPLGQYSLRYRAYSHAMLNHHAAARKDIERGLELEGRTKRAVCAQAYVLSVDVDTRRSSLPVYKECLSLKHKNDDHSYTLNAIYKLERTFEQEDAYGDDAVAFAASAVADFSRWDTHHWLELLTERAKAEVTEPALEQTFASFRHLGKLVSQQTPQFSYSHTSVTCDDAIYSPVRYKTDMQYEEGRARLLLDVCKQMGGYRVHSFVFYHD
ncbi:tetratricopeptide repeat protein [Dasania marina]|uniref:tetratricopeptide repeat protein n=1 Tax=Dasania marina TaxID=471499 RepID=UPI00035C259A|nr:tetratricopeptide repeat protein [Dasania marina]